MSFYKRTVSRLRRSPITIFMHRMWQTFFRHNGSLLARGLAFSLLISSIPFIFIALYVSSLILADANLFHAVFQDSLNDFLPDSIADMLYIQAYQFISQESWRNIGVIGIAILLWMPHNLYSAMSSSLRTMMNPPKEVAFFWRHLLHIGFHFAIMIIFFFFAFIAISFTAVPLDQYFSVVPYSLHGLLRFLEVISSHALITAVIMVTLAAIYRMSYQGTIKKRFLFGVSLGIAILWQLINLAGTKFIGVSTRNEMVYGILAGGIILLVWAYLFSILLLLGGILIAQFEQDYQRRKKIPKGTVKRWKQVRGRKIRSTIQLSHIDSGTKGRRRK